MLKYLQQNKQVIVASLTLFIISLSTLLFFVSSNKNINPSEFHADVIADTKSSPASMHEQEVYYRKIAHNEQDPLIVLKPDASIEIVSWDFEVLYGHLLENIKDQPFYNLLHPGDLMAFLNGFNKSLQLQQTINVIGPYRLRDAKGQYHFHLGTAVPVLENNKVSKVILVSHDINESFDGNSTPEAAKNSTDHGDINTTTPSSDHSSDPEGARLMAEKTLK